MKKKLLYILIALSIVGCSGSIGSEEIMECFGKKDKQLERCKQ